MRPELAALFNLLRAAPRAGSIAESREQLEKFSVFLNANAPEVARVESDVRILPAGRSSALHEYADMPHAFMQLDLPEAHEAIATGCRFLKQKC